MVFKYYYGIRVNIGERKSGQRRQQSGKSERARHRTENCTLKRHLVFLITASVINWYCHTSCRHIADFTRTKDNPVYLQVQPGLRRYPCRNIPNRQNTQNDTNRHIARSTRNMNKSGTFSRKKRESGMALEKRDLTPESGKVDTYFMVTVISLFDKLTINNAEITNLLLFWY